MTNKIKTLAECMNYTAVEHGFDDFVDWTSRDTSTLDSDEELKECIDFMKEAAERYASPDNVKKAEIVAIHEGTNDLKHWSENPELMDEMHEELKGMLQIALGFETNLTPAEFAKYVIKFIGNPTKQSKKPRN